MREPNKANCTESIGNMTILMRCKLTIRNVTHHLKKKYTPNSNEKSLNLLLRRVIVEATAMKKAHKKPAPALMNLIQEAQCVFKIEIALNNRGLP